MTGAGWLNPFPRGTRISQRFGASPGGFNPAGGHTGTDYAVPVGTPVWAAGDGVIELSSWTAADYRTNPWWLTRYGGDSLVLNCGDRAPSFVYAHLSDSTAPVGTRVRRGEVIGYSGNSGTATTGPHCHVEALPPAYDLGSGTYGRVDPARYLTDYAPAPGLAAQGAVTVPKPAPPKESKKMLVITQAKGDPAVWIGDGITRRQIPDPKTLEDYRKLARWGVLNIFKNGETMDYPPAVLGTPVK
jgi:hypothetical protein